MERRKFNLLAASSLLAVSAGVGGGVRRARAATAGQAALLQTTLTPIGAERGANADGSIPAWNGGMTEMPSGVVSGQGIMPDFFAGDQKVLTIDASNVDKYQDRLAVGTVELLKKFSKYRLDVYPTHRTACAPQWVYDNIAKNAVTAQVVPGGGRFGFVNAYGGVPFPIPDSDPDVAGAQIMLNHAAQWKGTWLSLNYTYYNVENGSANLTGGLYGQYRYCYYEQDDTYDTWNKYTFWNHSIFNAPASAIGEQVVDYTGMNPLTTPTIAWIYLAGQGRVRKAPELQFDNPASSNNGTVNYDDNFIFVGSLIKYDWKSLGKKEMYIPYNSNKLFNATAAEQFTPDVLNPDVVRWELHRVWVVDATLHPGERHTLPHRRFYFDEDTWSCVMADGWDAAGNYWRHSQGFPDNRPDVPGTIMNASVVYDLQRNLYATLQWTTNDAPYNGPRNIDPQSLNSFNPQAMAAQEQY